MKTLKDWFKERNNWHYIKGALTCLAFYIISFEAYHTIARFAIGILVAGLCAVIWEIVRPYPFDKEDVKRDLIGAVLMCLAISIFLWFTNGFVTDGFKL